MENQVYLPTITQDESRAEGAGPLALNAGIPWQHGVEFEGQAIEALDLDEWYNWLPTGQTPMLWNLEQDSAVYKAAVEDGLRNSRTWLILNEPERSDQANYTAEQGKKRISAWRFRTGYNCTWVGPNVQLNEKGFDWLTQYRYTWKGAIPDAWGVHIYEGQPVDWQARLDKLYTWMRRFHCERPVWITETCSAGIRFAEQVAILEKCAEVLRSGQVEKVFWYSARDWFPSYKAADLLRADGALTALGIEFLRARG